MSLLQVGLLMLSLLVISVQSNVIIINTKLLRKNVPNIAKWIAGILLGTIVKSLFK